MHFNVGHTIRLESDLVSIEAHSTMLQLSVLQVIKAKTTWIRGKFKQTTIYTSLVCFLSLCFQTSVFNTAFESRDQNGQDTAATKTHPYYIGSEKHGHVAN